MLASAQALVEIAREDVLVCAKKLDIPDQLEIAKKAAWSCQHRLADALTMINALVAEEI